MTTIGIKKINDELRSTNNHLMKTYRMDVKEYEKNKKAGNLTLPPEKPRLPILLIPANTTSSKLTEQHAENAGATMALLFETETDAMTNMMGNKFGGDNSMIIPLIKLKNSFLKTGSQLKPIT
jgi:hypothetical protein